MKKYFYSTFFTLIAINSSLSCVEKKSTTNVGEKLINTTITKDYTKQGNTVGRPIKHDWRAIFKIIDEHSVNPITFRWDSGYKKYSLLELAVKSDNTYAINTLVKKYKAKYPNTKEALFDAIQEGNPTVLNLMDYGARVNWQSDKEFLEFILDPRFIYCVAQERCGEYASSECQNNQDDCATIVKKVVYKTNLPIKMDTYLKVIEKPWGEWFWYGTSHKMQPKDNPHNKIIEEYIRQKSS